MVQQPNSNSATVSSASAHPDIGWLTHRARFWLPVAVLLILLYIISLSNYLLFHVLVELFSVIVAFAIFMFAWNTRANLENSAFVILGVAYLAVGAFDLLHTLSYEGMGVFHVDEANVATQLWIAARYTESMSIAGALLLSERRVKWSRLIVIYGAVVVAVIATIYFWPIFPTCYIDGVGLTPFKKISEYVISGILVGSLVVLFRKKHEFDRKVLILLVGSILFTIVAEVMFTFYISVFGISNLVGHFFKLASFWMIYVAIVQTGLQEPYKLLFREVKENEKQLLKSRQRFKSLVDNLPDGICEIDAFLRIRFLNPAGMELLGYGPEDIERGIYFNMLLPESEQSKAETRIGLLQNRQKIENTEYHITRKDGSVADVIVKSASIINADGIRVVQKSLTDITELNRLQHRLQQAHKMEAVAHLAGGMAHEVNNALAGLMGNIELMKLKSEGSSLADSDFSKLETGCNRIATLISQLLAYSRGGRYRSESIDMETFVATTLKALENRIGPRIEVDCTAEPGLPQIMGDPMLLTMMMDAVLGNAVEAIGESGRIRVDIKAWQSEPESKELEQGMRPGRYLRIRISDDGKGMDAETVEHIFEPFYSDKFTGRGLGMAAAYGIVKNHGGWIGLDSTPGLGTTVRIFLPVAKNGGQAAPGSS